MGGVWVLDTRTQVLAFYFVVKVIAKLSRIHKVGRKLYERPACRTATHTEFAAAGVELSTAPHVRIDTVTTEEYFFKFSLAYPLSVPLGKQSIVVASINFKYLIEHFSRSFQGFRYINLSHLGYIVCH